MYYNFNLYLFKTKSSNAKIFKMSFTKNFEWNARFNPWTINLLNMYGLFF